MATTLAIANCQHAPTAPAWPIICAAGHFGGTPSPGLCEVCRHRVPRGDGRAVEYVAVPARRGYPGGRAKWLEVHGRAASYAGDVAAELRWLDQLAIDLPCGDCRDHYNAFRAKYPPPLHDRAFYFYWTIALHNSVNRRLGRKQWSLQRACRRWRMPRPW